MRIGFCTGSGAKDAWGVGFERIGLLAGMGYDYLELPLTQVAAMPREAFENEVLSALHGSGIACEAVNNCFPGDMRLTGPGADHARAVAYAEEAFARAGQMGVKVIVFGSGGARNVPAGGSIAEGYGQLAALLARIAPIAEKNGCAIAIEPLNRMESNIVTSYESGLYLAALSGRQNVGTLVDAYHFALGRETPESLLACTPLHAHYANTLGRRLPADAEQPRWFFDALACAGYQGRVSLEGQLDGSVEEAAPVALAAMRAACGNR